MAIEQIEPQEKVFPYLYLTIGFLVAIECFEIFISALQLNWKKKNQKIPEVLRPLNIQEVDYEKSRAYNITKIKFSMTVSIINTVITVLLLYFFYYPWVWNISGDILAHYGFDASSEFKRALVFIAIDNIREKFVGIPISYISSFVIEAKYGFNKMTLKTFVTDILKTFLILIILTPPILFVLLWVIEAGGKYFYLYVEGVVFVMIIIMMFIYPNFIAPLFNKFEELPMGPLRDKIYALAEKLDYPLTKIFVCDGSKRSSHSNAYLFGFWKNKRIVLFDTLLKHLDEDEIEAVLGHELGHWKKGHTWKGLVLVMVQVFVIFYVYGFFMYNPEVFLSFGFTDQSIFIGIVLFILILTPINFVLGLIGLRISRAFEYQADHFSTVLGYADKLSSGLIKLFKENSGDMDPHPWYASFRYTHPALVERLNYIAKCKGSGTYIMMA